MILSAMGVTVVGASAKPRKSKQTQVEECVKNRLCVICGDKEFSRGLCSCHHREFRNKLLSLPEGKRFAYEAEQMKQGKLVRRRGGRPRKKALAFDSEN